MNQWLDEYGESHQSGTNKIIHWICVPCIMFSLLGIFWAVPLTIPLAEGVFDLNGWLNLATLFALFAIIFYARLSLPLAIGMGFISMAMLLAIRSIAQYGLIPLLVSSISIFVIAWIGQFIGHKIEGKKPSFFKDIQFLLIGPAWFLSFIYKKLGIPY